MNKIPNFDKFDVNEAIVAAGFGMNNIQNFGLGGGTPQTGYSMGAIAGTVGQSADAIGAQAHDYEMNDNDDHTAEGYLNEAKKHVNESIDKAYESCKALDEGMSKAAIKKSIKIIDKMIDTETGGDGEALDNETLQALEQERERLQAMNEALVQVAGKDKPSGAKVLATVIADHLIGKGYISAINGRNPKGSREQKVLVSEIQDLIIKSTF